MILLNFSHPLTGNHLAAIKQATGHADWEVREIKTHFDSEWPFADQVVALVNQLDMNANTWQSTPILINPPSLNAIALTLFAELHGRMGYFPAIIRLKPVPESLPPQYEFAEIINLQALRDRARAQR